MRFLYPLLLLIFLFLFSYLGVEKLHLHSFFGIVIPYICFFIFLFGIIYRIIKWGKSPVPFRITTTCGQQKSLPGIKSRNLENPYNIFGVIGRMVLEILFFRSLFRNTKSDLKDGKLVYGNNKWLWLGSLVFHWSFLIILLRHFRFFTEPVPSFVHTLQTFDGIMELFVPVLYLTNIFFLLTLSYLLLRRLSVPQLRYISLPADYFPLFLIISIAVTGILMRYFPSFKVDLIQVKELVLSLIVFSPSTDIQVGSLFYMHFFLVCFLFAYFPFSKLIHFGGIFLSPTRNLVNNNRAKRHINPWNYEVKYHKYEEWEDEFREVMKESGLPVDKE
jgi:nitrate reductase gamma subunit